MRMRLFSVSLILLPAALAVDPLVDLGYAKYIGTAQSNGISSWLGLRYAAPPLGDLRFRAPRAPLRNDTVQSAAQHGLLCLGSGIAPTDNTTSEDCLYLDVYAPSNATSSSKLPVYFFIQGGSFNTNANGNYRGDGLIQAAGMNIVVVNFNYRVSLYGFLASEEITRNGNTNVGLLDQRKAMEWVQQYISLFGGDPNHVTLGGASAGAASIAMHLSAYGGRDIRPTLFHAAVAESQFFSVMLTIPQAQYQYDALVERVGCNSTFDTLACLRRVPATTFQADYLAIPFPGLDSNASAPRYMYGPVIDGGIIQDYTDRLFALGKFLKVPVIFGDDTNEGTHFTPQNTSDYGEVDQWLQDQYPGLTQEELDVVNILYPISEQFNGTGSYWWTVSNAFGEMCMICPGISISSAYSAFSNLPNYNYRYNVLDPAQAAEGLGVQHTVELGAVWGPEYISAAPPASLYTTNAAIIPVIQGYWTSFIRSYDPNTYRAMGTPEWLPWNMAQGRLLFQTNATQMETVPQDLASRCVYLSSIEVTHV